METIKICNGSDCTTFKLEKTAKNDDLVKKEDFKRYTMAIDSSSPNKLVDALSEFTVPDHTHSSANVDLAISGNMATESTTFKTLERGSVCNHILGDICENLPNDVRCVDTAPDEGAATVYFALIMSKEKRIHFYSFYRVVGVNADIEENVRHALSGITTEKDVTLIAANEFNKMFCGAFQMYKMKIFKQEAQICVSQVEKLDNAGWLDKICVDAARDAILSILRHSRGESVNFASALDASFWKLLSTTQRKTLYNLPLYTIATSASQNPIYGAFRNALAQFGFTEISPFTATTLPSAAMLNTFGIERDVEPQFQNVLWKSRFLSSMNLRRTLHSWDEVRNKMDSYFKGVVESVPEAASGALRVIGEKTFDEPRIVYRQKFEFSDDENITERVKHLFESGMDWFVRYSSAIHGNFVFVQSTQPRLAKLDDFLERVKAFPGMYEFTHFISDPVCFNKAASSVAHKGVLKFYAVLIQKETSKETCQTFSFANEHSFIQLANSSWEDCKELFYETEKQRTMIKIDDQRLKECFTTTGVSFNSKEMFDARYGKGFYEQEILPQLNDILKCIVNLIEKDVPANTLCPNRSYNSNFHGCYHAISIDVVFDNSRGVKEGAKVVVPHAWFYNFDLFPFSNDVPDAINFPKLLRRMIGDCFDIEVQRNEMDHFQLYSDGKLIHTLDPDLECHSKSKPQVEEISHPTALKRLNNDETSTEQKEAKEERGGELADTDISRLEALFEHSNGTPTKEKEQADADIPYRLDDSDDSGENSIKKEQANEISELDLPQLSESTLTSHLSVRDDSPSVPNSEIENYQPNATELSETNTFNLNDRLTGISSDDLFAEEINEIEQQGSRQVNSADADAVTTPIDSVDPSEINAINFEQEGLSSTTTTAVLPEADVEKLENEFFVDTPSNSFSQKDDSQLEENLITDATPNPQPQTNEADSGVSVVSASASPQLTDAPELTKKELDAEPPQLLDEFGDLEKLLGNSQEADLSFDELLKKSQDQENEKYTRTYPPELASENQEEALNLNVQTNAPPQNDTIAASYRSTWKSEYKLARLP